jgi:ribosomal protein L15E
MLWENHAPVTVVNLPGFLGPKKIFEVVIVDCPEATAPNDWISSPQNRISKLTAQTRHRAVGSGVEHKVKARPS